MKETNTHQKDHQRLSFSIWWVNLSFFGVRSLGLIITLQVSADGSDKDEIEKLAGAIAKVGLSQCMQVIE